MDELDKKEEKNIKKLYKYEKQKGMRIDEGKDNTKKEYDKE